MDNIEIAATERSPEISFDFEKNLFRIKGESYPEDVNQFYGSIIDRLKGYLTSLENKNITFDFELIYFNSSSAKILMGLFELLDKTAVNGNQVSIYWHYEEDDDNMEELGEEFAEDLEHATFKMQPKSKI